MFLVITTGGCVFGSYSNLAIPVQSSKKKYTYLLNDPDFFVFSLVNDTHDDPQKFTRKKPGKTICVWSDNQKCIFSVKRFFRLARRGPSAVDKKFKSDYVPVPTRKHYHFTGSSSFEPSKIVVLQWV